MTLSPNLKEKIRKYSLMVAWWNIHENDKSMKDKLEEVLEKIEVTEEELRLSGVSEKVLEDIIKRAKKFTSLTVGEMSDKQVETTCKLIFGQKVTMETFDKRELLKKNVHYLDPEKELKRRK